MSSNYFHPGWTGEPYKSDFEAKWGTIKLEEMLDCSDGMSLQDAAKKARASGYDYVIINKESKHGNRLYKVQKGRGSHCVYAMLGYLERNARKESARYRNNLDDRIVHIVKAAQSRSKKRGVDSDLDTDDILRRVRNGTCEATGMPFDLTNVNSPYAPSLDQIIPQGGYTKANVQVVCMIYNRMKADYTPEEVDAFIQVLVAKFT